MDAAEALAGLGKTAIEEIGKPVYEDGLKPVVKPTGELAGLVPRAIKAALLPVEKWVLGREYNLEETRKLLEQKLADVPPEEIVSPEPYVAVPAIQYISYCMDSEVLRDMYANLLAKSMQEATKDGVHPSYLEIIKQLCPDEARLLKDLWTESGESEEVENAFYPYEELGFWMTEPEVPDLSNYEEDFGSDSRLLCFSDNFKRLMILQENNNTLYFTFFGRVFCRTCIS